MPKYWMISNRNKDGDALGSRRAALSFWVSDSDDVAKLSSWTKATEGEFAKALKAAAAAFPLITEDAQHERQKHVALFVHGFNVSWENSTRQYRDLVNNLIAKNDLGLAILFTWPSDGSVLGYLPDRADAKASGPDLAHVLDALYQLLLEMQREAAEHPENACRAKTSIIAHSMGNFVLQHAMQAVWTRNNQPLLVSLVNQLLMVAADVDNDLFAGGEAVHKGDGDAIANLTYRITALYTGRDAALGASAGLKHFGKRRLGRSGLDDPDDVPDNVWAVNCSRYFTDNAIEVHSEYFKRDAVLRIMAEVMRGKDRTILEEELDLDVQR